MTLKISEMISQRADLAKDLSAGLGVHLEEIAAGYESFLSQTAVEGEPPVDVRQQLVQLQRSIDSNREDLEALNQGVVGKIHGTDQASSEAATFTEKVIRKMRFVRDTGRNLFGKDFLKRTALEERLPLRPLRVYERSRLVQSSLSSPEFTPRPVIDVSVADAEEAWTPARLASSLEPEITRLGELVDERYSENRENSGARALRRQGIKKFDRNMRGIVRILQGMLVLADRKDLVDRFSTSLRRFSRRRSSLTDSESTPGPEPTPGS